MFWMLHVHSIPDGQTLQRLYNVRIHVDALVSKFNHNINPSPICVDETMVVF